MPGCECIGICCCVESDDPPMCAWCEDEPAIDGELCADCLTEAEEEGMWECRP